MEIFNNLWMLAKILVSVLNESQYLLLQLQWVISGTFNCKQEPKDASCLSTARSHIIPALFFVSQFVIEPFF